MGQMIKNLPVIWKTQVRSLGSENPLEKGMANHSNILAWRIPMDRRAWWATVHGVTKSQTWLRDWHFQLRRVRRPEEGALMFCKEWPTGRRKTPLLYWKRLNAVKLLSPDYSPPKFFFSSIRMFFFPWSMGTCT